MNKAFEKIFELSLTICVHLHGMKATKYTRAVFHIHFAPMFKLYEIKIPELFFVILVP